MIDIPDDCVLFPFDYQLARSGVPVFAPTIEQLADDKIHDQLEPGGTRFGVVKIQMPRTWQTQLEKGRREFTAKKPVTSACHRVQAVDGEGVARGLFNVHWEREPIRNVSPTAEK